MFSHRKSILLVAVLLSLYQCIVSIDSRNGAQYIVKGSTWQETLRLTMEKVGTSAPATTGAAATSSYILSPTTPATDPTYNTLPKSHRFDIDVRGWTSIWLVNDFDPAAIPHHAVQNHKVWYFGVWADAKFIMADGRTVYLSDMDGFCSAYEEESISCNKDRYGKGNRYAPTVDGVVYQKGLSFQGNSIWHFEFPAGFNPVRFQAIVGVTGGPNQRFRVFHRADHKLWLREMWARLTLMYYSTGVDDELRLERNEGIWEEPWQWQSVNGLRTLALRYAAATPNYNNWKAIATSKANTVQNANDLDAVRWMFHAAKRIPDLLAWKVPFTFSGRNITHLSDFNALRDQVTEMQRMFGSAYKTAGQHLQMINTMITTYNKATSMATATSNGKEALQAAIACRETSLNLSKTFPPWLHENFDEFPLPTPKSVITVRTPQEYLNAILTCAPGKHVILEDGLYEFTGSEYIFPYDRCNNLDAANPVVVRAKNPGKVHITGNGVWMTRMAANVIYHGLVFRNCSTLVMGVRYYSRNIRITHCTFIGTDDQYSAHKTVPSNVFDYNFMASGLRHGRRISVDDGLTLLGYPKMAHNFFGYRRRLVGNGAELMQNYYWAEFSNNFIHRYIGEAGEIIKCSGPCLLINNTVTETAGTFPGRSGKLSVIEGNYYLSMGLRGGGGYGKVIRNNYIENGALTAGSTEYPTVLGNVIDISHNTHINSRLHIVAWANDPRHQFNFTFNNNLLQNPTYTRETDNENEWKGSGNKIAGPTIPNYLPRPMFSSDTSITFYRDQWGVLRPKVATTAGTRRKEPPYFQFDTRVGPYYLPTSVRINRNLLADFMFTGYFTKDATEVVSDWGNFIWRLRMKNAAGANANLKCAGLPGSSGNTAFCNPATTHGAKGGVVTGPAFDQNINGFSVQGWFKTSVALSSTAVLVATSTPTYSNDAASIGFAVRILQTGALQLSIYTSNAIRTYTSAAQYATLNEWQFWAVNFNPATGRVQFFKGGVHSPVTMVTQVTIPTAETVIPTAARGTLSLGALPNGAQAFAGAITNVRIWASEAGPDRIDYWGDSAASVSEKEFEYLRLSDLNRFSPYNPEKPPNALVANFPLKTDMKNSYDPSQEVVNDGGVQLGGFVCFVPSTSKANYLYIPESLHWNILATRQRTFSLSIRPASINRINRQVIYTEGTDKIGFNVYITQNRLYVGIWDQYWNISNHVTFLSTDKIKAGGLHKLVVKLNAPEAPQIGNSAFEAYLDGVKFGSGAGAIFYPHHFGGGSTLGTVGSSTRFADGQIAVTSTPQSKIPYQFNGCVNALEVKNSI